MWWPTSHNESLSSQEAPDKMCKSVRCLLCTMADVWKCLWRLRNRRLSHLMCRLPCSFFSNNALSPHCCVHRRFQPPLTFFCLSLCYWCFSWWLPCHFVSCFVFVLAFLFIAASYCRSFQFRTSWFAPLPAPSGFFPGLISASPPMPLVHTLSFQQFIPACSPT